MSHQVGEKVQILADITNIRNGISSSNVKQGRTEVRGDLQQSFRTDGRPRGQQDMVQLGRQLSKGDEVQTENEALQDETRPRVFGPNGVIFVGKRARLWMWVQRMKEAGF
jgi:hypothetical protein